MEIHLLPAGCRAAGLWLALAGAALGGPAAFLGPGALGAVWGAWGLFCLWFVWGWCPTARLCRRGGALVFTAGRVFSFTARLPLATVSGLAAVSSPLMRRAGCCLLVVFSSSGLVLALPGAPCQSAAALARLLKEEGREWI